MPANKKVLIGEGERPLMVYGQSWLVRHSFQLPAPLEQLQLAV